MSTDHGIIFAMHWMQHTHATYAHWAKFFIRWHALRHPRKMAKLEIEAFLAMLANERHVAASTHNQQPCTVNL